MVMIDFISQPCKDCERLINIYIKKYKLKNFIILFN